MVAGRRSEADTTIHLITALCYFILRKQELQAVQEFGNALDVASYEYSGETFGPQG